MTKRGKTKPYLHLVLYFLSLKMQKTYTYFFILVFFLVRFLHSCTATELENITVKYEKCDLLLNQSRIIKVKAIQIFKPETRKVPKH